LLCSFQCADVRVRPLEIELLWDVAPCGRAGVTDVLARLSGGDRHSLLAELLRLLQVEEPRSFETLQFVARQYGVTSPRLHLSRLQLSVILFGGVHKLHKAPDSLP
jgi:hypothetical protein